MYKELDTNGDGEVDQNEFVDGFMRMNVYSLKRADFIEIFKELDRKNEGALKLNEFGMFIEGAQLTKQQRINNIPHQMLQEIHQDID